MSGRGKLIAALLVVLLMALAASWPVADHYRLKRKLEEYKQQLRAKGERLAIAECVPARHTEDRQAIHDFLVALGRMRSPSPSDSNYPPAMKFIAPGRALVAWRQDILPTDQVSNVWPGLSARLGENQEGLAELRAALQRPVRSFDLDYSQGHEGIRFPHLPKLKEASQWLLAATILDLHEGRVSNAWKNVKALSALVEWNRDEPLTLSELVRIGICQIALNATWEAWQSSEMGEAQLRELQNTWESVDVLSQAESALAMERALSEKTFAKARESFPRTAFPPRPANTGLAELRELGEGLLEDPKQGIKAILQRYPGYWAWKWWHSYDDELASAEAVQAGLEAVRRARKEHANAPAHKQFDNEVALVKQAHAGADTWLGISSTL